MTEEGDVVCLPTIPDGLTNGKALYYSLIKAEGHSSSHMLLFSFRFDLFHFFFSPFLLNVTVSVEIISILFFFWCLYLFIFDVLLICLLSLPLFFFCEKGVLCDPVDAESIAVRFRKNAGVSLVCRQETCKLIPSPINASCSSQDENDRASWCNQCSKYVPTHLPDA